MFKWLFQSKKILLEKANAKRLEEEEWNREDIAGAKERVEYLFNHRTNDKGQPFTFADLEVATASQNPARQVTVSWINELINSKLGDLVGHLGRLNAISDFFRVPTGINFWFGDFTEEIKTQIRVTNNLLTHQWQNIYDTESVLLQPSDMRINFEEYQISVYREALDNFLCSSDFKPTLVANLLLWPNDSFLLIGLNPDKAYKVFEESNLKEEPFNFTPEKLSELIYLLKEGWDFEWYSPSVEGNLPTIFLSVSVPAGIVSDQVKQGGSFFVQQLLDNSDNLGWITDHFHKRLDYILGLRSPDPSITAHHSEVVARMCRGYSRVITVGDVRKINKAKDEGQPLSSTDESIAEFIKLIEDISKHEVERTSFSD